MFCFVHIFGHVLLLVRWLIEKNLDKRRLYSSEQKEKIVQVAEQEELTRFKKL